MPVTLGRLSLILEKNAKTSYAQCCLESFILRECTHSIHTLSLTHKGLRVETQELEEGMSLLVSKEQACSVHPLKQASCMSFSAQAFSLHLPLYTNSTPSSFSLLIFISGSTTLPLGTSYATRKLATVLLLSIVLKARIYETVRNGRRRMRGHR